VVTETRQLLILGASTRAAAFSALRAELRPWCIDLFADLDLRKRCPVQRLTGSYPHSFLDHLVAAPPGPWMYAGGLENWPRLVRRMADRRVLWGNSAAALTLARDPEFVTTVLQAAGMPVPALRQSTQKQNSSEHWLLKRRRSAGGSGVRFASAKETDGADDYCQEYIEGKSCSLLYLGDGRRAVLLGMTEQLVGASWLHAGQFRYSGSIGPMESGLVRRPALQTLGDLLAHECGLYGLCGVDGVLRDDVFWPVEINPRYTASVEVLEYAAGLPALLHHARVFTHGTLPSPAPPAAIEKYVGKAILFARADLAFPDDGPWLTELRSPTPIGEMPAFADIPTTGERIEAGRPILTFFACAGSPSACADELRRIAADLDRWLFGR
jgi:predicted ATP-grasp superfamily ATP-dependent carboligase